MSATILSSLSNPVTGIKFETFSDIPNLQLWLDASDSATLSANSSNRGTIIDSSSNNFTITRNGNVGQGSFSPFSPNGSTYNPSIHGGSAYFDGANGNYLSIPSNAAFNFVSGTLTIECWVMFTALPTQTMIVTNYNSTATGWYLQQYQSKFIAGFKGDDTNIQGTTTIQTNVWYHVAVSGSAGSYKLFVNGIQEGATYTGATSLAGGILGIGSFGSLYAGQYVHSGYISNFRILNGTALYTGSTLTVPTVPLTTTANTSLLLNFTNGFALDGSTNNTLSMYGDSSVINSVKKYGLGSFTFDGNGDYILAPSKSNYAINNENFTIECWVRFTNTTTGTDGIADTGSTLTTANANQWALYRSGNVLYFGRHGGTVLLTYNTSSLVAGTWYHIAVTRESGNLSMYVDGVRVASTNYAGWSIDGSNIRIGAIATPYYMNGFIDDFRLTRGVSRYGPSTVLLLNGNGSDNASNNTFLDSSSNNFTITRNGSVTQGTFSPFPLNGATYNPAVHGGSGYFNGSGNYLYTPTNSVFDPGSTGTWTFETWVYPVQSGTFFALGNGSAYGNAIEAFWGSNKFIFSQGNSANSTPVYYDSSANYLPNQWYHYAVSKDSINTIRVFVNGVNIYSTTFSGSVASGCRAVLNGVNDNRGLGFQGGVNYISNLRWIKGTSLYTSNFTPPTAPLTNITNTSLLLNFTNGGIIDSTGKNDLITVGDAKISTSVKKYGSGSLAFNGSTDFLTTLPNNSFSFGTGDFTVETWIYYPSFTNTNGKAIIDARPLSTNGNFWVLALNNTGIPQFATMTAGGVTIGATQSYPNQWTHIAVTRQSGTLRFFVNGIVVASSNNNLDNISSSGLTIGANVFRSVAPDTYFNGYIDDLRITKGVAVYTSNFTPPAQELGLADLTTLSVAPFTPPAELPNNIISDSNFNNVALLLQANELTNEVTWRDKSSNGNVAYQPISNLAPLIATNAINNRSALAFNGTHFLTLSTPISTGISYTQFFVFNRVGNGIVSTSLGFTNIYSYLWWSVDNRLYSYTLPVNQYRGTAGITTEGVHIGSMVQSIPRNTVDFYLDGISRAINISGTTNGQGLFASYIGRGGSPGANYYHNGLYGEVLQMAFEAPRYEVDLINRRLFNKWKVP